MIILEGPDGSGKTTFLKQVLAKPGEYVKGPRACTSEGGPVDDLFQWAKQDVLSWSELTERRIYDRHPFISEFVYGPTIRGDIDPKFLSMEGLRVRQLFIEQSYVLFFLPPLEVVKRNVIRDTTPQMPGVREKIEELYHLYAAAAHEWPGMKDIVDYTKG